MANVPVEIRWADDEERQQALTAIQDVNGRVNRELDGLIEAEVPDDVVTVLRDRRLAFSFPKPMKRTEAALTATDDEDEDPFPRRVQVAKLAQGTKDLIQAFADKTLRVGIKKTKDAFVVRKEPRKKRRPEIDGLNLDVSAMMESAVERLLPEPKETLPEDAYLVRLNGPIESKWGKQLQAIGPLGDHRPPDTFRMVLTPAQLAEVQALPFVRSVKRYGLLDTLTPSMVKLLDKTRDFGTAPMAQFDVTVHMPAALQKVEELLNKTAGVHVIDKGPTSLRFETTIDSPILSAIAQLPIVRTLSPFEPPQLFLDQARFLLGVDAISPTTAQQPNGPWDGTGEKVAVFDSGVDPTHPDIAPALDRPPQSYKAGVAIDANGHGTHVAAIIAGRGIASNGLIRGIAPGAKVLSFSIVDAADRLLIPVDLGEMLQLAVAAGANVINLSWGKKLRYDYDVYGESIDRFARTNPEVLVVVAAGNEGVAEKEQGPRLGFHRPRTIGMPAAAKNVLTVGACCNRRQGFDATWGQLKGSQFPDPPARDEPVVAAAAFPAAISSRGPTGFDAVKPDILAPGTMVLSAKAAATTVGFINHVLPLPLNGTARYGYLNGTSMAAPMAAGATLILRQFLRIQRNTPRPSAALLKGLLILSARRIRNANVNSVIRDDPAAVPPVEVGFPDFDQGFGVMDLSDLLAHSAAPADRKLSFHDVPNNDAMALEARVESNSARRSFRTYKLEIPADSTTPLKVVLVWTDVPGRGVQNLLSLEVKGLDGIPVPGNHGRRIFIDALAVALGATPFDKHNSAQLVTLPNPVKGTYRITVRAEATTAPPQGYALAACGPLKEETLKPLF